LGFTPEGEGELVTWQNYLHSGLRNTNEC